MEPTPPQVVHRPVKVSTAASAADGARGIWSKLRPTVLSPIFLEAFHDQSGSRKEGH